jgi:ribosome-binding factor A
MSRRRIARLNEQFRREISEILRREVRDPRVGSPTVTGVEVTPDLWLARVYVRPGPTTVTQATPGTPEEGDAEPLPRPAGGGGTSPEAGDLLAGLEASAPFVRHALGKALALRRIPELRFLLDRSLDDAARIERILKEVAPPPDGGDAPDPEG